MCATENVGHLLNFQRESFISPVDYGSTPRVVVTETRHIDLTDSVNLYPIKCQTQLKKQNKTKNSRQLNSSDFTRPIETPT